MRFGLSRLAPLALTAAAGLVFLLVVLAPRAALAVTREVGPGQPYATIGAAVAAAATGDVLNVHAATYSEQVMVDKTLTLQAAGDGPAIVSGGCTRDNGLVVTANNVTIRGLTVQRTRGASIFLDGFVVNPGPIGTVIDGNTLQDWNCANFTDGQHYGGVAAWQARQFTITNNLIRRDSGLFGMRTSIENANTIWFKSNTAHPSGGGHVITGNTLIGGRDGIGGETEDDPRGGLDSNSRIANNTVQRCEDDGIQVDGHADAVTVEDNTIVNCGIGISLTPYRVTNNATPLVIRRNVITNDGSKTGVYGNLLCFKVGDNSTGKAVIQYNDCRFTFPYDNVRGDGVSQTNQGTVGTWDFQYNVMQARRYVYEIGWTLGTGSILDNNCLGTTDPNRWASYDTNYYSLTGWQAGTGFDAHSTSALNCPPAGPPGATPTATVTATSVPPTATNTATATPTNTPVPPTATATATSTPSPTPTNTPTPVPPPPPPEPLCSRLIVSRGATVLTDYVYCAP